jgi:hypothetical protein
VSTPPRSRTDSPITAHRSDMIFQTSFPLPEVDRPISFRRQIHSRRLVLSSSFFSRRQDFFLFSPRIGDAEVISKPLAKQPVAGGVRPSRNSYSNLLTRDKSNALGGTYLRTICVSCHSPFRGRKSNNHSTREEKKKKKKTYDHSCRTNSAPLRALLRSSSDNETEGSTAALLPVTLSGGEDDRRSV